MATKSTASASSESAEATTPEQREEMASKLVDRFAIWSGVAGLIPLPVVDVVTVGGLQIQMLRRISQIYEVPFSENTGKALIAALAGTLIPVPFVDLAAVGGVQIEMLRRISKIYGVPFSKNSGKAVIAGIAGSMIPASSGIGASSLIKGVPGIGTAISALTMPTLSVGATYAIGMAFIQHFASGGTLLDFNPPDYREFIKAQKAKWDARSGRGKSESSETTSGAAASSS